MGKTLRFPGRLPGNAVRWGKMFALSAVVGVLSGLAAAGLNYGLAVGVDKLIGNVTHLGGAGVMIFNGWVLFLPAIGGLLSGILVAWLVPHDHGHGTNQLITAYHHHGGQLALRGPSVKAVAAIGVISFGGSAGPEGPIAALGASIGSAFSRLLHLSIQERRILLIAGCGGGVGAIFQCPLGGALFATSILYREPDFEADCIVPAFVSSVLSYSTFIAIYHHGHLMLEGVQNLSFSHPIDLVAYLLLGPICALLVMVFHYCLKVMEARPLRKAKLPPWVAPALGGLLVGVLGCFLPQVMDGRYEFIENIAQEKLDESIYSPWGWVALFGAVALFKCVASALTVGSGAAGGTLGPSVVIGGMAGAFLGALLNALFPGSFLADSNLQRALIPVGMGGVLAASMRTPMAAIVMITEMTGSYGLIVPLMLVCVTSYVIGRRWGLNPAQVRSPDESPAHAGDALVHMLEAWRVRDLMDRNWPYTVKPSSTLGEVVSRMSSGTRPTFAVVDEGKLMGVISVTDIARVISEPWISDLVIAEDIMVTGLTVLHPDQDLYEVLTTFKLANHEVLPVVAERGDSRFQGMLTRQAIHEAVRTRSDEMRGYLHREHEGIAAIEQDEQMYHLVLGVSAPRPDTIQRMPVPHDAVGKSLREADFRRQYGAQVIGVQNDDGTLRCPPDIDTPLKRDQLLLVILSTPAEALSTS